MKIKPIYLIAGVAVAAALGFVLVKKKGVAADAGAAVAGAIVDFANTAAGTVVQEVAAIAGVPKTNMTECERALAEGRTWDASFVCPAGTFLKHVFD